MKARGRSHIWGKIVTYAIFIDAGYFKARFRKINNRHPKVEDIKALVAKYSSLDYFKTSQLYRVFYYDSLPPKLGTDEAKSKYVDPFTKTEVLKFDEQFILGCYRFWNDLMKLPYFAMRKGALVSSNWELSPDALKKIENGQPLSSGDIFLSRKQKQVDMKIGMDISHVALKKLVNQIILVAGDADMAPAAKQARVEGIQVFLDPMGHSSIREDLHNHVDICL